MTRDRRVAEARLNGLLARPADAPFAEPEELPTVPPAEQLEPDRLLERARQHSPLVVGADAEIAAAQGGRQLVAKSWYPDISLGAAAIWGCSVARRAFMVSSTPPGAVKPAALGWPPPPKVAATCATLTSPRERIDTL